MEELMSRAVDYGLSLGAKYVEVRWQSDQGRWAGYRNGQFEFSGSAKASGFAVRAVAGGGLGFAATPKAAAEDLLAAVERAVKLAKAAGAMRRRPVELSEERLAVVRYELPPIEIDLEDYLAELDSKADKRVSVRRFVGGVWTTEKWVVTSDGANAYSKVPRVFVFGLLIGHEPSKGSLQRDVSAGGTSARSLEGFDEFVAEESRKVVELLDKARAAPPGRYDLVFSPEMAGIFVHESVGHPFELDRIFGREGAEAGESYVKPQNLAVEVGSGLVNVVDDPTIPGTYGFYLVDEEGVPARPKWLLRGGKAAEFITNRQYAAVVGVHSNAGARASAFDREPIPRMSNTYLVPGDWKPEEIIRDTKRGIYVASYTEWNIDDVRQAGRYGFFEAYMIENGELKEPVRGFLEVDTKELWSNVDAVGRDFKLYVGTCGKGNPPQGVPVTMGGPTFRSRNLLVLP
ncbi:MAG: TldD/PmbA family protein [Thermoproteus sp.]